MTIIGQELVRFMNKKVAKGSVSVKSTEGRLRLRFTYQGVRYSKNLFSDNSANRIKAARIISEIEIDIRLDILDTTLTKYLNINKLSKTVTKTFIEWFEKWSRDYKQKDCEKHINYCQVRNMIRGWKNVKQDNVVSQFNKEIFSATTFNRRLTMLKSFGDWLVNQKVWVRNPLNDVSRRQEPRNKKKPSNRVPFTLEEIRRILEAFKTNSCSPKKSGYTHSYYYPFIYFVFKTGVRNAEAIGLRVKHLDFKNKRIRIDEVMARSFNSSSSKNRVRKSTKNEKERDIPFTDDLQRLLYPLIRNKNFDDLVFVSPNGLCIDDNNFRKRIFYVVLDKLQIPRRVLYACRHTFGSRCIDAGLTPVMVSFLMGNNPETVLRTYTHQINLPKNLPEI